jgi:hypothetical protein
MNINLKKIVATVSVTFMLALVFIPDVFGQRRGRKVVRKPVIVRQYVYYDPFWQSRYWGHYGPYAYNPYYRYRDQRYRLERELAGNERELAKHLRKYNADGVITAKERRELDDDFKDVRESRERLSRYSRYRY